MQNVEQYHKACKLDNADLVLLPRSHFNVTDRSNPARHGFGPFAVRLQAHRNATSQTHQ